MSQLAHHIVVNRTLGTIAIDGEPLPWDIAPNIEIDTTTGDRPQVTFTIIGDQVQLNASLETLDVDGTPVPWVLSARGPRIEYRPIRLLAHPRLLLVTIDVLADRITEHVPVAQETLVDTPAPISVPFAITDRGKAIVESGLSVRHLHELETGCTAANPCAECRRSADAG